MDERNSLPDEFPQQYGMPQHQAMFASPTEADAPLNDDWAIPETSPTPPHQRFVLLLRLTTVAAFALIIATVVFLGSLVGNTMQATSAKQVIDGALKTLEHGDFQSLNITEQELNGLAYPTPASGGFGSAATPVVGDLKPYGNITYLYQSPNLWRVDTDNQITSSTPDTTTDTSSHSVALSDGSTYWEYFISNMNGQSYGDIMHQTKLADLSYIKNGRSALTRIFQTSYYSLRYVAVCGSPILQGSEAVNGRDAYVITYQPYYSEAATPTSQCAQLEKQLNQEQNDEFSSESGSSGVKTMVGGAVVGPGIPVVPSNRPKPTYRMWVDKQTFLVLKTEETGGPDGKPIRATEVTSLQVNTAIDAKQFTAYDKPANNMSFSGTPMTATQELDFPAKAGAAAKAADYPIFIPNYLPSGLVPIQASGSEAIMAQSQHGVAFSFAPGADLGKDTNNLHSILNISQHRASYADIAQAEMQGNPIDVGGIRGWATQPISVSNGSSMTGSIGQASVSYVRDGTFVQISGSAYHSDELVKVAVGLQPAPNSHAPLPTPQPPTIAQVRQQSKQPVYVPTDLPSGVVAEPPIVPQLGGSTTSVSIIYHNHDGSPAFVIEELNMGDTLGGDIFSQLVPAWLGQQVKLSNTITATYIPIFPYDLASSTPGFDGSWFISQQGATTILMIGPGMGKADFVKIANSLSATADLGTVELPPDSRPNPQLAPPGFKVLHPTALPDAKLKPQERIVLAPNHAGSGVIISYTPNGQALMFNGLRLVEMPASAASDLPNDPKATHEQIAGHEVSVTRNKNACQMMTWQQDGVYFALINVNIEDMASSMSGSTSGSTSGSSDYGTPGRYTYEQMKALVESLK